MKFLSRLCQFILFTSIGLAIILLTIGQIALSGAGLSQLVRATGGYDFIAAQARDNLTSSPRVPEAYQPAFTAALNDTLNGAAIETMVQPAIVDVTTWLNQPKGTEPPDVIIVIKPVKDQFATKLAEQGLPVAEARVLQAEVSSQIPDQIKLSQLDNLTGNKDTAKETAAASPSGITSTLTTVKQVSQGLQWWTPIILAIIALTSLLIFAISHTNARAALRHVAWPYIIVGLAWLTIGFVLPMLWHAPVTGLSPDNAAAYFIPRFIAEFLVTSRLAAGVFTGLGLGLYLVSFLIHAETKLSAAIKSLPGSSPKKK